MSDYPTSDTPIKTIGLREVCEVNGRHFSRRKGTEQWIESKPENSPLPPDQSEPLYLSLVQQKQGPDEPYIGLFLLPVEISLVWCIRSRETPNIWYITLQLVWSM